MSDASPWERLRRAGLKDSLAELFGADDADALDALGGHLRWVDLPSGSRLYRQGDPADDLHVVAGGRLRAIARDESGRRRIVGEISRGETVGEMALLAGQTRTADVYAVRDSVLLGLDRASLEAVVSSHPRLVLNISRLVSERLRRAQLGGVASPRFRAITVVPHRDEGRAQTFVEKLVQALARHGPVTAVDGARAARQFGPEGGDDLRARAGFDALERENEAVVYVADTEPTAWSRRCVTQCDVVLVVAGLGGDPAEGPVEEWLSGTGDPFWNPRRELVLLHPDGAEKAVGTERWTRGRTLHRHHHVRLDRDDDVARVARFMAGRAVGLVLAGGGAPGFAHIGVIRALREAGVPIDAVGGTSIGSIVAAGIALGWGSDVLYRSARGAFTGANPLGDYTVLPLLSLSKGRRMERLLRAHLGGAAVEDTWLPFFCVSADISTNEEHVFREGPLWRAVRTSCSVPGVLPPMVHDDHLHIDGSSVNNLPVDVMRGLGVGRIVAVDLDSRVERKLGYAEVPSPWSILARRLIPGLRRLPVPGIMAVVMKSTMIAGVERAARVRESVDLYLAPPVHKIGLLDWKAFDKVVEVGYRHAVESLDAAARARLTAERRGA